MQSIIMDNFVNSIEMKDAQWIDLIKEHYDRVDWEAKQPKQIYYEDEEDPIIDEIWYVGDED
jgi:hypothetical protein